jgi:NhaP-type Na+/H+ or K+/H+ antiporter
LGWGVQKGIPDAILTGSALSDVLLLLVFSLLLAFLNQSNLNQSTAEITFLGITLQPLLLLPFQVVLQITLGISLGWLTAKILVLVLVRQNWTQNAVQDVLVTASTALFLVVAADKLPIFSGYLAVMALGFFLIEFDAPLARRLRSGFDSLWAIAEIFLFVLLGASIQIKVLGNNLLVGLVILAIGTLIGRSLGWYLSTLGSNWNWRERIFLLSGNSAKATVQAAIGAIPLAQGINGGETILAIAALSILVTAPLGAWSIPIFAPKLLERGEVDPTKNAIAKQVVLLAAIDTSALAPKVLIKAAELARRNDAEVIALYVIHQENTTQVSNLEALVQLHLADIRHRFLTVSGVSAEAIINNAQNYGASEIIIGKRGHQAIADVLVGSVSQAVLENSQLPVIIVEDDSVNQR